MEDYHFEIKQEVLDELKCYTQNYGNEKCGILMGSQIDNNHYRISKISPPCCRTQTRLGCIRDAEKANRFIQEDFHLSNHTRFYIGEWHTHPEPYPTPSDVDISSIKEIHMTASLVAPILFMIIVGIETIYISVYNGIEFKKINPKVI